MNRFFRTWIVSRGEFVGSNEQFQSKRFILSAPVRFSVGSLCKPSSAVSYPHSLLTTKIESSGSLAGTRINREIVRAYSTASETSSDSKSDGPTTLTDQDSGHESTPYLHNDMPFRLPTWAKLVMGALVSSLLVFVPSWKPRWDELQPIEGSAKEAVEEAEMAAEVVEKAASVTENVSKVVSQLLPDNSKSKDAALWVERVSKEIAQDAHLTQDFIHKVNELKQDVETMVDPNISKDRQARMERQ